MILIDSPDFRMSLNDTTKNPYIVMKDNTFKNNMAYFAGNAFHISMPYRMLYDLKDFRGSDAW